MSTRNRHLVAIYLGRRTAFNRKETTAPLSAMVSRASDTEVTPLGALVSRATDAGVTPLDAIVLQAQ